MPVYVSLSIGQYMGHVRNYVITDVIARLKRMQIEYCTQWDGTHLACQLKTLRSTEVSPAKWTYQNIVRCGSNCYPTVD